MTTRYEYKVAKCLVPTDASDDEAMSICEAFMNDLGAQGWKIFRVDPAPVGSLIFLFCIRELVITPKQWPTGDF